MCSIENPIQKGVLFRFCLAMTSGLLLGFSFPPSPFYSFAYVAFVPLFFLFSQFDLSIQMVKYSYLFLFVFHVVTVYWTGGYSIGKDVWMMTAGAAIMIIHPLFFLPSILLSFFVKKKLGLITGLIAFALFWTSFEYLHSLGEYSFPWLTIGNSQAYELNRIQIIEYSSIYGLSLLIFAFNIFAFYLLWKMASNNWKFRSLPALGILVILTIIYFGPVFYGKWVIKNETLESGAVINVGVIQPNVDPWDKWGEGSRNRWDSYLYQFNTLIEETKNLSQYKPDLVIWPETAIPFYILSPRYEVYYSALQRLVDTSQFPIFTGLPIVEYFDSSNAPATAQRIGELGIFAESYNSAMSICPKRKHGTIHKKSILVPFAERIPYAETFRFLIEPLKWNVGISGWGKGADTATYALLLRGGSTATYSGMICYESAYPDYVREFVKHGAEFLVIITNDSWWGNTSGAYQHASFASLRAVETRRWVIQCANGGISMIVAPTGITHLATSLYCKTHFLGDIRLKNNETFYVKHGDILARLCLAVSMLMISAAIIKRKERKESRNELD